MKYHYFIRLRDLLKTLGLEYDLAVLASLGRKERNREKKKSNGDKSPVLGGYFASLPRIIFDNSNVNK